MGLLHRENLSRGGSVIHRLPAWLKLAVAFSIVVATSLVPAKYPGYFLALALGLGVVVGWGRISLKALARRILFLEPLVLGIAGLAFLQPNGAQVFLTILLKSTLCLVTLLLLAGTTPFIEWLRVLKSLRMPDLLVTTVALMYRYLFVLLEELERMRRARASRTFSRKHTLAWSHWASLLGQLFIRSSERAERIYAAMCARGWK
jgi:cobalt/nickel transport system permease protein